MRVYHRKCLFAVVFVFVAMTGFSQVVKTPFPVDNLTWTKDGRAFSFTEEDNIFLRDSANYQLLDTLTIYNAGQIKFSTEATRQVLLTLTKDGIFAVYALEEKDGLLSFGNKVPHYKVDISSGKRLENVVFSENSDFIAVSTSDNVINLFFKLRFTQNAVSRRLEGQRGDIYNLSFSKNSKYLISTSDDGTAFIWDCNKLTKESEIKGIFTRTKVPAVFLNDSQRIICCDGETSFSIYDFAGTKQVSINTLHAIRLIKPLADSRKVAVLTDTNEIEIYDLNSNKWLSYIPSFNPVIMTDFEFNRDDSMILIGHEDGSIYKFNVKSILLNPGAKPQKRIQVFAGQRAISLTRGKTFNSVFAGAGANILNSPFAASVNGAAEFRYGADIFPFFFGAGVSYQLGFPRENIASNYYIGGEQATSLTFRSGNIYVPFGVQFSPWGNDLYLLILLKGGIKISSITLHKGTDFIIGDPEVTFMISGGSGIVYKLFEASVNLEFDGIGKVTPSFYAGLNFKFGEK